MIDYVKGNAELAYSIIMDKCQEIKVVKPEATYLMWLDCSILNMSEENLIAFSGKKHI